MIALLLALFVSLQVTLGEYNGAIIPAGLYKVIQNTPYNGGATCRTSCCVMGTSGLSAEIMTTSTIGALTCGYIYNYQVLQNYGVKNITYSLTPPTQTTNYCTLVAGSSTGCTPCAPYNAATTSMPYTTSVTPAGTANNTNIFMQIDPTNQGGGQVAFDSTQLCPAVCTGNGASLTYTADFTYVPPATLPPSKGNGANSISPSQIAVVFIAILSMVILL